MSELDDLLQPSVAPAEKRPFPWRVSSQFWVAFFGGIPAVTVIAFLNARRLGATARKQQGIVLSGVAAAVVFAGLFAWMQTMDASSRSMGRLAGRVLAVLLYLVLAHIQREDDGRYQVFGGGQYASLWIPGILACVISALALIGGALVAVKLLS
ncbi:MAG TPA: hypothetical protein VF432_11620 [Thermoanaerobaculia bacterium]